MGSAGGVPRSAVTVVALVLVVCATVRLTAQSGAAAAPTIVRDDAGGATIRAVRVTAPIRVDGRLDEAIYASTPAISDFIQMEPHYGEPATDRTEAWILFDDTQVYVAARCWVSEPDKMVANEMRRDSFGINQNDHVGWTFDTFFDRRNAVMWIVNPLGGRLDGQITDERVYNGDFNPVYQLKTGRFEGGWTLEAAIPFKSLRYRPGRQQTWGFNMRRQVSSHNETDFLMRVPQALAISGLNQVSKAARVVGIEAPQRALSLELKPYAIGVVTTDRLSRPAVINDPSMNAGIDAKYGVTQNLTADLTYRTDFAQVEADEQQINLTRFNLFFPEKREFFLENQGTFSFGSSTTSVLASSNTGDAPTLFYSRRIGLRGVGIVPIEAGGRLTGRVGRYTLGLLAIGTEGEAAPSLPGTTFAVARVKRDVLRRSAVGLIATHRSRAESGPGSNDVFGADATFAFREVASLNGFWATSRSQGLSGDRTSYRTQFDYNGDRYGLQAERLVVGDRFDPGIGFTRRRNIRKNFTQMRFSPRPRASRHVRKYTSVASFGYIETGAGRLDMRTLDGEFSVDFIQGDRVRVAGNRTYEVLPAPFPIARGVVVPQGGYGYASVLAAFRLSQLRRFNGEANIQHGTFYDGHRTIYGLSSGRFEVTARMSLQPTASINRVRLRAGAFTTTLLGTRATYTITPLTFVSALVQYNSAGQSVSSNVRFRWEYRPGSELFVVYNEQRDTRSTGLPELQNRALIVKLNTLLRF